MKSLLKSKTFYTGLIGVLTGVAQIINGDTNAGIQLIITGLSAIFIRNAIHKGA